MTTNGRFPAIEFVFKERAIWKGIVLRQGWVGKMIYHAFYSKNTYEALKRYVFESYPTQPKTMTIESVYCFVTTENGKNESTPYHVLEISKKDGVKLRILENVNCVGGWDKIISMGLQGMDYTSLLLGTNRKMVRIDKSPMMYPDTQTIKYFEIPEITKPSA